MNLLRYSFLTAILFCFIGIQAQEQEQEAKDNQLTIDAQVKARGEIRKGGLPDDTDGTVEGEANFLLSRTRLTIDYQKTGLELKVTAQHSGVWGQANNGTLNLYEAWAKLTSKQGLFVKVGRQELSYDDERIIGSDDWTMAAASHDVVKLGYEGHGHKAHVILAYNQNAENTNGGTVYRNGSQPYKTMHTLWYHYDVPRFPLGASLLFMNIGMQSGEFIDPPKTFYQQLYGGYLNFHPRYWEFEASGYVQKGKNENNTTIDAWMASTKATFTPSSRFSLNAGFGYLSGDPYYVVPKPGTIGLIWHEKEQGFNPVYGSHHKFYGAMDFFYVSTYFGGFSPGLQNFYIGGDYSPLKGLKLSASYHYLAMASHLDNLNMTLGHEIEFFASYEISKDAKLSAGFSFMTGTETMERLKRASNDNNLRWTWLTLTVSPRIFQTRW